MRRVIVVPLVISLVSAAGFFGRALWLEGKAVLAQQLIAAAWERTLDGESRARPWPWADTWPVARLVTPDGADLYVLNGFHGQALAFGPGHLAASALPEETGRTIIAGHRDSHFRFLEDLAHGQELMLQDRLGLWHRYRVAGTRIVDSRRESLRPSHEDESLILVTCYPFRTVQPGGPLRYVVVARPVQPVTI